jgi:hypothetical protein
LKYSKKLKTLKNSKINRKLQNNKKVEETTKEMKKFEKKSFFLIFSDKI